jgi:hypothetical protein
MISDMNATKASFPDHHIPGVPAGLEAEEEELRVRTATTREAYDEARSQLDSRKQRMQESDEEVAGTESWRQMPFSLFCPI